MIKVYELIKFLETCTLYIFHFFIECGLGEEVAIRDRQREVYWHRFDIFLTTGFDEHLCIFFRMYLLATADNFLFSTLLHCFDITDVTDMSSFQMPVYKVNLSGSLLYWVRSDRWRVAGSR
jgi:hypothetical protein